MFKIKRVLIAVFVMFCVFVFSGAAFADGVDEHLASLLQAAKTAEAEGRFFEANELYMRAESVG